MTSEEFNTWTADLCRKFPAIAKWLEGLGAGAAALMEEWAGVLVRTDFRAALEANQRMLAGDEGDLPGEFASQWQTLPAQVRRIAGRSLGVHSEPNVPRGSGSFQGKAIIQRIIELRESGLTPEDAKAQALQEFPIGPSTYEPRYDCHYCQDSGRVTVASNHAIIAALEGTFDKCHHREGAMRCNCRKGLLVVRKIGGRELPIETFDPNQDFRIIDFCWPVSEVERFTVWAQERKAKFAEDRYAAHAWTPDTSRHREFAP